MINRKNEPRYVAFDLSIFIAANFFVLQKTNSIVTVDKLVEAVERQLYNILINIKVPVKQWVLCADSSSFRKVLYRGYKEHRIYDGYFRELRASAVERLSKKFIVKKLNGLEGDDLLYLYSKKYKPSTIISNDGDCKLMLTQDTNFYRYREREWFEYDSQEKKKLKIQKVFIGDPKDNIPRIFNKRAPKKLLDAMCSEMMDKPFREICDAIVEKYGIDQFNFERNIVLTLYAPSIYHKYVENFNQKLTAI